MRQDSETNIIVLNTALKYKIQRNTQKKHKYIKYTKYKYILFYYTYYVVHGFLLVFYSNFVPKTDV